MGAATNDNKNKEQAVNKQPVTGKSTEPVRNPNPRANENLPDAPGDEKATITGPGSEITDGEDG
jgi:hypothetical protein